MERTTTTEAFMRGFYKVAFDAGLSPDQAAEMHAMAIINEAKYRSPEFARGFDKIAGAYPWYHPGRWLGMSPTPAAPSTPPPIETPTPSPALPAAPSTTPRSGGSLPSDQYRSKLQELLRSGTGAEMDHKIRGGGSAAAARG